MDIIISFFRDTLVGPFYIVWVVVCIILIFACIGYLAEKGINNKKEKEKYATVDSSLKSLNEATINDTVGVVPDVNEETNEVQVEDISNVSTNIEAASSVLAPVIDEVTTVSNLDEVTSLASNNSLGTEGVVTNDEVVIPSINVNDDSNTI